MEFTTPRGSTNKKFTCLGRYRDSCLHQHGGQIIIHRSLPGSLPLSTSVRAMLKAEAIIVLTRQEIELFEEYSGEYGYEFFLFKNKE